MSATSNWLSTSLASPAQDRNSSTANSLSWIWYSCFCAWIVFIQFLYWLRSPEKVSRRTCPRLALARASGWSGRSRSSCRTDSVRIVSVLRLDEGAADPLEGRDGGLLPPRGLRLLGAPPTWWAPRSSSWRLGRGPRLAPPLAAGGGAGSGADLGVTSTDWSGSSSSSSSLSSSYVYWLSSSGSGSSPGPSSSPPQSGASSGGPSSLDFFFLSRSRSLEDLSSFVSVFTFVLVPCCLTYSSNSLGLKAVLWLGKLQEEYGVDHCWDVIIASKPAGHHCFPSVYHGRPSGPWWSWYPKAGVPYGYLSATLASLAAPTGSEQAEAGPRPRRSCSCPTFASGLQESFSLLWGAASLLRVAARFPAAGRFGSAVAMGRWGFESITQLRYQCGEHRQRWAHTAKRKSSSRAILRGNCLIQAAGKTSSAKERAMYNTPSMSLPTMILHNIFPFTAQRYSTKLPILS